MPAWLEPYISGGSDWMIYVVLVAVFGTVFLIVVGASALVGGRSVRNRLGEAGSTAASGSGAPRKSLRYLDSAADFGPLTPVARRLLPTNMLEVSEVRLKLIRAGYYSPSAIGVFYAARVLLAIALPALFLIVAPMAVAYAGQTGALGMGGALGLIGLYLPNAWVSWRTGKLQTDYRMGFPDALDLLIVCVEAGLGLDAAIAKVGLELAGTHNRLGEKFLVQMTIEIRAGTARGEALRNLADRLGIDEVRSLVTLLIHSEELGTSIADALRAYSEDMRIRRLLTAELKANQLSVKLSIPLVLFVFPVIMTVILLPVVIRVMRQVLVIKF